MVASPRSGVGRYYDPTTGQFLTVDPLVDQTGDTYVYAGDNPVSSADPSGRCSQPFGLSLAMPNGDAGVLGPGVDIPDEGTGENTDAPAATAAGVATAIATVACARNHDCLPAERVPQIVWRAGGSNVGNLKPSGLGVSVWSSPTVYPTFYKLDANGGATSYRGAVGIDTLQLPPGSTVVSTMQLGHFDIVGASPEGIQAAIVEKIPEHKLNIA
jgi:hypothetical protein